MARQDYAGCSVLPCEGGAAGEDSQSSREIQRSLPGLWGPGSPAPTGVCAVDPDRKVLVVVVPTGSTSHPRDIPDESAASMGPAGSFPPPLPSCHLVWVRGNPNPDPLRRRTSSHDQHFPLRCEGKFLEKLKAEGIKVTQSYL